MTSEVTWNKIFILTYPHCEFNNKDIRLVSSDGVSPRMSLLLTLNRYLPAGKGSEQLILEHLGVAPSRWLFSRKAFSHRWKLKIKENLDIVVFILATSCEEVFKFVFSGIKMIFSNVGNVTPFYCAFSKISRNLLLTTANGFV